jgi:hypothetical protein
MKKKTFVISLACLIAMIWIVSVSMAPPGRPWKKGPPPHAQKVKLKVLNPRGKLPTDPPVGLFAPRVQDLNGMKLALISTTPQAQWFFSEIEVLIKQVYPDVTVIQAMADQPYFPEPDGTEPLADVISECDTWINGVQDMGAEEEDWSVAREKMGKPGVEVVVERLLEARLRRCEANGMPTLRIVTIPDVPWLEGQDGPAEMALVAADLFDSILEALTSPLTYAEMNPEPKVVDYCRLTFTGGNYSVACEKFQKYFNDNEMGDGLALIPPTREAVDWMLTGTSRSPHEEIGRLTPGYGMATIEKIAINAVMAGAKPEYLPVIIAAMEVIAHPTMRNYHLVNSAGSPVAVIWVSGPIAQEIGMNAGMRHLGKANRPNMTIGRAVDLCNLNIGWALPSTDCAKSGRPFRNFIIAENVDYSPWTTYAELQGYGPEDSIVTINETMGWNKTGSTSVDGLVNFVASNGRTQGTGSGLAARSWFNNRFILTIYAGLAMKLAKEGITVESLQQYIYENARKLPSGEISPEGDPVIADLDYLAIMVSGGLAGYSSLWTGTSSSCEYFEPDAIPFISKLVHGATLTEAGR